MKKLINNGSYVIIEPIKQDGLWEGRVISFPKYHDQFKEGDIVYYKDEDTTQVIFKEKNVHLVLYYLIPFIEKEDKPNTYKFCNTIKGKTGDFMFSGLTI